MSWLEIENLTVRYGELTIVDQVSFSLDRQQWLMIVGPNGAGKSTIVNAIARGLSYSGKICFDGTDIARFRPSQLARRIGVLAQSHRVNYAFTVEEVVQLGRYSHARGLFRAGSDRDQASIEAALAWTGMTELRAQSVLTLSGGELQRMFLAQVLAQEPRILLLDEPTNHLDLVYQKQIFELLRTWIDRTGGAVVSVVHDLSLAKAYGTDALLLDRGRRIACGPIRTVLTRTHLASVYNLDVYQWLRGMFAQWLEQEEDIYECHRMEQPHQPA
jgi:iron complex transport system ATP-binding protein